MKKIISLFITLAVVCSIMPNIYAANVIDSGTVNGMYEGENLKWSLDNNGTLTISGNGNIGYINYIETPPWKDKSYNIINLVIEDGISGYIGRNCYSEDIEKIVIGKDIDDIYCDAFANLKEIEISDDNPYFLSVDGVAYSKDKTCLKAYPRAKDGYSFSLPQGVKCIDYAAFRGANELKSIILNNSIEEILYDAFADCKKLEEITFPASTKIINNAFSGCIGLKMINVDLNNESFSSIDGVLYNKDKTELIKYPPNKEGTIFNISKTVTDIADGAFDDCVNLESINASGDNENLYSENGILYTKENIDGTYRYRYGLIYYPNEKKETTFRIPDDTYKIYCEINNSNLKAFVVSEKNEIYETKDGVLYFKDGSSIAAYPSGKTDEIFKIPSYIDSLDMKTFNNNPYLKGLIISKKLMRISDKAVNNCINFSDVYYTGTEDDWADISRGGDLGDIETATIHFNYESDDSDFSFSKIVLAGSGEEFEISGGYRPHGEVDLEEIVKSIVWTSSDEAIAEITNATHINSSDGKSSSLHIGIKTKKPGTAKITGQVPNGESVNVTLTIPEFFAFDQEEYSIKNQSSIIVSGKMVLADNNKDLLERIMKLMTISSSNTNISYDSECYEENVFSNINFKNYELTDEKTAKFNFTLNGFGYSNISFGYSNGRFLSDYAINTKVGIYPAEINVVQFTENNINNFSHSWTQVEGQSETIAYPILSEKYWSILKNFENYNELVDFSNSKKIGNNWEGACFGLSTSIISKFKGIMNVPRYSSIDKKYISVNNYRDYYLPANDKMLRDAINFYHILQLTSTATHTVCNPQKISRWGGLIESPFNEEYMIPQNFWDTLALEVKQNINEYGINPILLSYQYFEGGHAIVLYGFEETSEQYEFKVYDPNGFKFTSVFVNKNDYTVSFIDGKEHNIGENWETFSYYDANKTRSLCKEILGKSVSMNISVGTSASTTFIVEANKPFVLKNHEGKFLKCDGEKYSGDMKIVGLRQIYSGDTGNFILNIENSDTYTITEFDDNFKFSLGNSSVYNRVETKNANKIEVSKENVIVNGTNISAEITAGLNNENCDLISYDAKANSSIKLTNKQNEVSLESDNNMSDIKAKVIYHNSHVDYDFEDATFVNVDTNEEAMHKILFISDDSEIVKIVKDGEQLYEIPAISEKAGYNAKWDRTDFANIKSDMTVNAIYTPVSNRNYSGSTIRYAVSFETNGGSKVSSQSVSENSTVKEPTAPTKDGFEFTGWYSDKELKTKYDFSDKVTKSITLYAAWTEKKAETTDPTDKPSTPETKGKFTDVNDSDWFSENVEYVLENGLMSGVSENKFAPNDNLTRAMLVTILYRAAGEPEVNKSVPFADVKADSYYANAVIWAQQNGIVSGVSENEFAPDTNITREQIATIMFRYAKEKGYDVSVGESTNILSYTDAEDISEYAIDAMQYAVGSGLIKGKSETTLNPKDTATRAEIAAILQRFIEGNK